VNHLAVVMPAYNEAEGLPAFLEEIRRAFAPSAWRLSLVVVDDRSTDATADAVAAFGRSHGGLVNLHRASVNRGHGPTALAAYRAGLRLDPDVIVHVDGDGQFLAADFSRLVDALVGTGADVVHGVRRGRTDPWFRRALTIGLGMVIAAAAGRRVPDANTPFRAYRPDALRGLLAGVPEGALVPHVHFSLAEARRGYSVRYVGVRSIPRRGSSESGTMWGDQRAAARLPPKRLCAFSRRAAVELWRYSLRPRAGRRVRLEGRLGESDATDAVGGSGGSAP
jgi:dolichol-phosphate mannosyltransferase